jgi:hypothetical protein
VVPVPGGESFALDFEEVEPTMRYRRANTHPQTIDKDHDRMNRHEPEQNKATEVKQVLDGVHRDTRPWADVDVAVVQFMLNFIQGWPVGQSMDHIKMNRAPEEQRQYAQAEVKRVFSDSRYYHVAVSIDPPGDYLKSRQDCDARDDTPENVVPDLVAPQEFIVVSVQPALVEFVVLALATAHVKPPVQAAGN